jgi:hypothetical protein
MVISRDENRKGKMITIYTRGGKIGRSGDFGDALGSKT